MSTHTRLVVLLLAAWVGGAPSMSFAQSNGAQTSRPPGGAAVDATAEVALLAMANDARADRHLPALRMSPTLRELAREHSRDMERRGYVGHDSPMGASFLDRLGAAFPSGTRVGENVTEVETVEQANAVFLASALHLRNIIDPGFHTAGIGIVTTDEVMVVTEDFAQ